MDGGVDEETMMERRVIENNGQGKTKRYKLRSDEK